MERASKLFSHFVCMYAYEHAFVCTREPICTPCIRVNECNPFILHVYMQRCLNLIACFTGITGIISSRE